VIDIQIILISLETERSEEVVNMFIPELGGSAEVCKATFSVCRLEVYPPQYSVTKWYRHLCQLWDSGRQ